MERLEIQHKKTGSQKKKKWADKSREGNKFELQREVRTTLELRR